MITTTEFSQIGPRFFLASCPHRLENLEKGLICKFGWKAAQLLLSKAGFLKILKHFFCLIVKSNVGISFVFFNTFYVFRI